MSTRRLVSGSEAETISFGRALGGLVLPGDVVLLCGDLGAGKTQLTKGLAYGLGVVEPVTSPTFNILLVHEGRIPLYHFDLYRLEDESQLEDIDYFATLEADGVCVVEWGDRFPASYPADGLIVALTIDERDRRILSLGPLGPRGSELEGDWADACEASSFGDSGGRDS